VVLLTLNTICCSWPPAEAARSCRSFSKWLRALSVSVIASLGAAAGSAAAAASKHEKHSVKRQGERHQHAVSSTSTRPQQ
jgi:hypothetical protein